MSPCRARVLVHRAFFALVLLPFVLAFPYVRALNNPNEMVRVFTVMSLVENGTYRVDEQIEAFGWTEDLAHVPHADGGEHHAMVKAPAILVAGIPPYVLLSKVVSPRLGGSYPGDANRHASSAEALARERTEWLGRSIWAMRLFACQIPAFLFLVWFERYLRAFSRDRWLRYATVAAVGLGTNFLAYAHMFASHVPYAVAAFVAFAIVERELRDGRTPSPPDSRALARAAVVGFLTSSCVALEYQALPLAVVLSGLALATFRGPARAVAFTLGGVPNVVHVAWFQYCAYGHPLTPGHKLLENARFAAEHKSGLWGIFLPKLGPLVAIAFDPAFGLFGMSPFLVLGLVAVPLSLMRGRARGHLGKVTLAWFGCMLAVVLVNAGFVEWRAGWTVGPRYLVVCAPFFGLGALVTLERIARSAPGRRGLARGTGAGLAFASIVSVGTVGLLVDTLPDTIGRPFAQFVVPMLRRGFVPHDVGEWFGLPAGPLFYVAALAMLGAPVLLVALAPRREAKARLAAFVATAALGLAPALSAPPDGSPLFELHPSTASFAANWEPARR